MQDNWKMQFDGEPHRKENSGIRYLAGVPAYFISLGFLFFFGNYLDAVSCFCIAGHEIPGIMISGTKVRELRDNFSLFYDKMS